MQDSLSTAITTVSNMTSTVISTVSLGHYDNKQETPDLKNLDLDQINLERWDNHPKKIEDKIVLTPHKQCVLLIGNSQAGKSSLANFLIEGCKPMKKYFNIGTGFESKSTTVELKFTTWKCRPKGWEKPLLAKIGVADAPGLMDSKNRDETVLYQLYSFLKELKRKQIKISTIILVIKFPSLLDQNYYNQLKVYKDVFKEHMVNNLILAITNVKTSSEWIQEQEFSGINPQQIIENIKKQVISTLNLSHDLTCIQINSIPFSKSDLNHAVSIRDMIFERSIMSPLYEFNEIMLTKPLKWRIEDIKEIENKRIERDALSQGVTMAHSSLKLLTDKMINQKLNIDSLEKCIIDHRKKITDLDTDAEIVIYEKYYTDKFKWLPWNRAEVKINYTSQTPISSYRIAGGTLVNLKKDEYSIKAIVTEGRWTTVNCNLILYGKSNIVHREEILSHKNIVETSEKKLEDIKLETISLTCLSDETIQLMGELQFRLNKLTDEISLLQRIFITEEEYGIRSFINEEIKPNIHEDLHHCDRCFELQ